MKLDVPSVLDHLQFLFGYTVTSEEDRKKIEHLVNYTKDFIKAYCHRNDIPEVIVHSTLDKIVGDFLFLKKSQGDLTDGEGNLIFDFDKGISSVTLGNASVDLGEDSQESGLSPEAQFDNLIGEYRDRNRFLSLLNTVRKVKWNVKKY